MKKILAAALILMSLLFAVSAMAQEGALPGTPDAVAAPADLTDAPAAQGDDAPEATGLVTTTKYRWFVNKYRYTRGRTVTYYDNVYAYNHGKYYETPFDSNVPAEYFVVDELGTYALAPIVLDITDAMRVALYGGDFGETVMFFGQYCERIRDKAGRVGFSGVHEGIDFKYKPGATLYAILGGTVTRAGDSNGTVAIYNEEYNVTVLYLHCEKIVVRRGDVVEAGEKIAVEGDKGSGTEYTHVEVREGRHTTSNTYRDIHLQSTCPYPVMQEALGVMESGRQPVTAAAIVEAQRMREEAEAAAEETEPEEEQIELVDELPGTQAGYGFGANAAPQATLPPVAP